MKIYISMRELLLFQIGYLMFDEMARDNADTETILERLHILQSALDEIKSYRHNTHFQSMIKEMPFELEEDDLEGARQPSQLSANSAPLSFLHPYGFGFWISNQSFVQMDWNDTMDDVSRQQDIWRTLVGKHFIKKWKKKQITTHNVIQHYSRRNTNTTMNENGTKPPYIDISIPQNTIVEYSQFRLSITLNRLFELELEFKDTTEEEEEEEEEEEDNSKTARDIISGRNLFDCVQNQYVLRVVCCLLWRPQLALHVLEELISEPKFAPFGSHTGKTEMLDDSLLAMNKKTSIISITDVDADRSVDILNMEHGLSQLQMDSSASPSLSFGDLMATRSSGSLTHEKSQSLSANNLHTRLGSNQSILSIGTNYVGDNINAQMSEDEIFKYLMTEDDGNDQKAAESEHSKDSNGQTASKTSKKSKAKQYAWTLMVDALNAFELKVCDVIEFTDAEIARMCARFAEGIAASILDQRSGLISVACNLMSVLGQFRTELYFKQAFFEHWMVVLLCKCANRDKIRTAPAHKACSNILFEIGNKCVYADGADADSDSGHTIAQLQTVYDTFLKLWNTDSIDARWMRQQKSVTQFVHMCAQFIQSFINFTKLESERLQPNADNVGRTENTQNAEKTENTENAENTKNSEHKNENENGNETTVLISEIVLKSFEYFALFMQQPHKEVRECASRELLINLYQLSPAKTFAIAQHKLRKKEFVEYLEKLLSLECLHKEHKSELRALKSRGRIRPKNKSKSKSKKSKNSKNKNKSTNKKSSKKKKKGQSRRGGGMRAQIAAAKAAKKAAQSTPADTHDDSGHDGRDSHDSPQQLHPSNAHLKNVSKQEERSSSIIVSEEKMPPVFSMDDAWGNKSRLSDYEYAMSPKKSAGTPTAAIGN